MNIARAFKPMADFEIAAAELYGWFAVVFADNSTAQNLFRRMAREEQTHLGMIEYQRRLLRANPKLASTVEIDVEGITEALDHIGQFRSLPETPTLEDALALSLAIENGAAEYHLRISLGEGDTELGRLMAQLGAADQGHIDRLEEFSREIFTTVKHLPTIDEPFSEKL